MKPVSRAFKAVNVGVANVLVQNGGLVVTPTDGQVLNAGNVQGPPGDVGHQSTLPRRKRRSERTGFTNEGGELELTLSSGDTVVAYPVQVKMVRPVQPLWSQPKEAASHQCGGTRIDHGLDANGGTQTPVKSKARSTFVMAVPPT